MKRTILTVAVAALLCSSTAWAQDKKAIDGYKAKIEASNKAITDAKKGAATKTWDDRAKLMVEAFRANTKGVYATMPASKSETNLFNNLETIMGAPMEKKTDGEYEIWVYPTVDYYIQDNEVQFWKETYVADPDALAKAVEAYKKAAEYDSKGGYKNNKSTKEGIMQLRNTLYNNGINSYMLKDYKAATKDFASALDLVDFPRADADTVIKDGQIAYYGALSAKEDGNSAEAQKLFEKAAALDYQVGQCYHNIYTLIKEGGDDAKAFQYISDAYKKFPKEEQILYDVINYYLEKKKYTEAENYLNTAISEHPDNLVLYSVKANIFITNYGNDKNKFQEELNKLTSLKKEAFRERNNPKNLARVEGEVAEQQKVVDATKANFMANQKKAVECCKQLLAKDANNYDGNFMLGFVCYDKAEIYLIEKDAIPVSETEQAAAKDKEIHACWKEACEWFEKAHKAKPTEKNPLLNLKTLYYRLGDTANNKRVLEELDKLGE